MAIGKLVMSFELKKWAKIPFVATVITNELIERATGKKRFFNTSVFFNVSGPHGEK